MRFSLINAFLLAAVPVAVSACEGECIVGITNAFLGNYTRPIHTVLEEVGSQIVHKLLPDHAHTADPLTYLHPLIIAYNNESYAALENAIFPSYFHGKCQQNGVDPPGCPNPDCPVVCGTPGSLVHFYPKLREIAFEETQKLLKKLGSPGSSAYKMIERSIVDDAKTTAERRAYPRSAALYRRDNVQAGLEEIMGQIPELLAKACSGKSKGLSACSWEVAMKEFILSWP
ncbi:hypothetical protein PLICRDRAFT_112072 [Plicaturopsis crispa FD-325 SS-3]|nr:hypothetical protein PLICRDRAFT_112072 [Plicaturopsis crispa FD-325 SS-3]